MLKLRVIPVMLMNHGGLVKGVSFNSWRRVGIVMPALKVYNTRDVDELMLMDITATSEGRRPDYEFLEDIASECFVPFTVGGGIRSIEDIRLLLKSGADKVSINSAAYENPELVSESSGRFGVQCIVVSVDYKKNHDGEYECFSHGGTKPTGVHPVNWCCRMEELGAGEILLTSIDRDGTFEGYDIPLIQEVSHSVKIPVIAAGGAGNYEQMYEVVTQGKVNSIAAASMFHFTEQTPVEAKKYLKERGLPVRDTFIKHM